MFRLAIANHLPKALAECPLHPSHDNPCAPARALSALLARLETSPAISRLIIFDVGTNNGAWSHALLNAVNASLSRSGIANDTFVEHHLFEPQPHLKSHLEKQLVQKYTSARVAIHFHAAAASVSDGNATFYVSPRNTFSSSMHQQSMKGNIRHSITVATLDLDALLEGVLMRRSRSQARSELVFLKMDVESAEFELLPHLFRRPNGPACLVDYWLIEWHLWKSNWTPERDELRRTIEDQIERQCPRRDRARTPRLIDHDERYSMHPPAPPGMPPVYPWDARRVGL